MSNPERYYSKFSLQASSAGADSEGRFFENGGTPTTVKNGDHLHHEMAEHHHVQQLERVSPTPPNQHQQQMHAHHLQQLEQLERHFEENNDLDENEEVRIKKKTF